MCCCNEEVILRFARLREGAKIPSKRDEDGGYDVYACFEEESIRIEPHTTVKVPTGIASVIPIGYCIQIEERGSTGSEGIKKSAGLFDSGFRSEWMIFLTNTNPYPVEITKKIDSVVKHEGEFCLKYPYTKAIAQGVLHKLPNAKTVEITPEELQNYPSERMGGMLGSSGK